MASSTKIVPKPAEAYLPQFKMDDSTVHLFVPGLPPSPNSLRSTRERMVVKKFWRNQTTLAAQIAKRQQHVTGIPFERAHVHFAICFADRRIHDADNINWAVSKAALDGIKSVLILDDSIDHIVLSYEYDRTFERGYHIWVTPL